MPGAITVILTLTCGFFPPVNEITPVYDPAAKCCDCTLTFNSALEPPPKLPLFGVIESQLLPSPVVALALQFKAEELLLFCIVIV
jgi:hypothetical protein